MCLWIFGSSPNMTFMFSVIAGLVPAIHKTPGTSPRVTKWRGADLIRQSLDSRVWHYVPPENDQKKRGCRPGMTDKKELLPTHIRVCPVRLAVFAVARPLVNRTAPQPARSFTGAAPHAVSRITKKKGMVKEKGKSNNKEKGQIHKKILPESSDSIFSQSNPIRSYI